MSDQQKPLSLPDNGTSDGVDSNSGFRGNQQMMNPIEWLNPAISGTGPSYYSSHTVNPYRDQSHPMNTFLTGASSVLQSGPNDPDNGDNGVTFEKYADSMIKGDTDKHFLTSMAR